MVKLAEIEAALDRVPDPELPVSIVELGMVVSAALDGGTATIRLLPTYTGCPALPMIESDVITQISSIEGIERCHVVWAYEPAWTPDRISESGLDKLKAHGVTACCGGSTVTLTTSAIPCPYCGSDRTRLDSPFGPTRCRAIHFCEACRNQFEHMKPRG
ncbi:MAG: phenylacetate-CoA oxygenase subunit PaaJ [Phycisphaerales bacterium]|jgi:ring-1,2-phenylacetyl-CoA epoxidase subunit PaaD|nr:phenylacetate-CoA oxygenase subunit PaaJ [Phycisphaerales bacterium]